MKILLLFSVLVVARAACDTLTGVNIDTGAVTRNSVKPEYSRVNSDAYKNDASVHPVVYKTTHYTSTTPTPIRSTPKAIGIEAYNKPLTIKPPPPTPYKTVPTIRRESDEHAPVAYKTETYTVPRSVIQTYTTTEDEKTSNDNEDFDSYTSDYVDPVPETQDYQPKEYPAVPLAVPVAVYQQYPQVARRAYRIPVYRRPSYARVFSIPSPGYRSLAYSRPVAYSVPAARRLAYAYAPPRAIRYGYESPRLTLDYGDYLEDDYDEFIKKKK